MDKKALLKAIMLVLVFFVGFLSSNIYGHITETPSQFNSNSLNNRTDQVASPSDWIKEDQIGVYSSRVILDVPDTEWASFTDTHSMEPVLSSRSNAIEIIPKTADEINVGDIVSYQSEYSDGTIIHRVVEKGNDADGIYFIMKGDNNPQADPGKIRFSQVKRLVIAIIY